MTEATAYAVRHDSHAEMSESRVVEERAWNRQWDFHEDRCRYIHVVESHARGHACSSPLSTPDLKECYFCCGGALGMSELDMFEVHFTHHYSFEYRDVAAKMKAFVIARSKQRVDTEK
jgi:hypothetical protein